MKHSKIAFIGGGNMAASLIHGLIQSGYPKENIVVSELHSEKRERLTKQFSIECFDSDLNAIAGADIIVLAIKPKDVLPAASSIKLFLDTHPNILLISIATGITTQYLHELFGQKLAIVRAMPNTAALLLSGATGLYADSKVSEEEKSLAESILRSVGITVWVNHEHDLDTITALSGSGPAYFFVFIEALQKGAERLGLSSSVSKILTLQTALGAARMALESEIPLQDLIAKVSTKGGTTEKALEVLSSHNLEGIVKEALDAAKRRAEELSKKA